MNSLNKSRVGFADAQESRLQIILPSPDATQSRMGPPLRGKKIRRSTSSHTGRFYSLVAHRSLGAASGLERDFYIASAFIPGLEYIEEQPDQIRSEEHGYRADTRLRFRLPSALPGDSGSELLIEVKYIDDLRKKWEELLPRLELGLNFARANGLVFKILTELEIRGSDFHAVRFFRRFLMVPTKEPWTSWLCATLADRSLSVQALLENGCRVFSQPPRVLLPTIWAAIAKGLVRIEDPPRLSHRAILHSSEGRPSGPIWVPCQRLILALLAPWEVRP